MANMFKTASKAVDTTKTPKKSDKREVKVNELDTLAMINALMTSLTAAKTAIEGTIKEELINEMAKEGFRVDGQPENFIGVDTKSTASMELRKRSSASVLSAGEVEVLTEAGIPMDTKVIKAKYFVINPEYADNEELLETVSNALMRVKNIPEDFIQVIEEHTEKIVADNSIKSIFQGRKKDIAKAVELLKIVGTPAVKTKLGENVSMSDVMDHLYDEGILAD